MATASQVVAIAKSQIGVHEKPAGSNEVKYNDWYYGRHVEGSSYPWCGAFESWVFDRAGMSHDEAAYGVYTPSMANWYKARGRWHTGTPRVGDIAFYDFGLGRISHTGIVAVPLGKKHHRAVEGNTSGTNPRDGGMVALMTRQGSSIVGYGRPYYKAAPAAPAQEDELAYEYVHVATEHAATVAGKWKSVRFDIEAGDTGNHHSKNGYSIATGPRMVGVCVDLTLPETLPANFQGQVRLVEVSIDSKGHAHPKYGWPIREFQRTPGHTYDVGTVIQALDKGNHLWVMLYGSHAVSGIHVGATGFALK